MYRFHKGAVVGIKQARGAACSTDMQDSQHAVVSSTDR